MFIFQQKSTFLMSTSELTYIMVSIAAVFLLFIIFAIIKMYKLKTENKRLMKKQAQGNDDTYKDFTNGHLYGDDD